MSLNRDHRVPAATRVKPAARRQQRAHQPSVTADKQQQRPRNYPDRLSRRPARIWRGGRGNRRHGAISMPTPPVCRVSSGVRRLRRPFKPVARASAASRSAPSSTNEDVAAAGNARTTIREPAGRSASLLATKWRSCRRTRLRTTAGPTARATTKPARGWASHAAATSKWTTSLERPDRRPRRTVSAKSERRRSRDAFDSMAIRDDAWSGGQRLTALAPPGRDDCPAGTGAHPQPEAMRLRAAAVVRLESPLAHSRAPSGDRFGSSGRPEARSTPHAPSSQASRSAVIAKRVAPAGHKNLLRYGAVGDPVKRGSKRYTVPECDCG